MTPKQSKNGRFSNKVVWHILNCAHSFLASKDYIRCGRKPKYEQSVVGIKSKCPQMLRPVDYHISTHACDLTLSHHVCTQKAWKTLRRRLCVRESHTHTHIQQENTRREAIRRGITAAANVPTSACLSWQPSVSFLASWDLHVSMCECVHMCLVEIRAADERSEHETNSECCFSLLCVRKPSYNKVWTGTVEGWTAKFLRCDWSSDLQRVYYENCFCYNISFLNPPWSGIRQH